MTLSYEAGGNEQLERYLLGVLPDQEAERLDEMHFADDAAWRLRVVEDDLVDAYVRGTLGGEALERFESFYLASERRRQKVRFARSLLGAVDRASEPAAPDPGRDSVRVAVSTGGSPSRRSIVPTAKGARILAAAAVLFLAFGAFYEDMRLRGALNKARRDGTVLSNRAHDLEEQLSRPAIGRAAEPGPTAARPTDSTKGASAAVPAIALVLLPQTRAVGPIATLAVPSGIDRVALELRLEPNDFTRYQAALRDPVTSQIVWRSDRLTARTADDVPTVSVSVPAGVLKPKHYSLELNGVRAAGGAEAVGSYIFEVVRR